jgi:hypothetical protein
MSGGASERERRANVFASVRSALTLGLRPALEEHHRQRPAARGEASPISWARAGLLVGYFKGQAQKVHASLSKGVLVAQAELITDWLAARTGGG